MHEYEILCSEAKKNNRYPSELLRFIISESSTKLDDNLFRNLPYVKFEDTKKINLHLTPELNKRLLGIKDSTQRKVNSICRVLVRNLHE